MRLIFFDDYRLGLAQRDRLIDVTPALGEVDQLSAHERILSLISGFAELRPKIEQLASVGAARPIAQARLRVPMTRSNKIVCAARNYRENGVHSSIPIEFFLKSPDALLDPGGVVELPPHQATIFHHEAEMAVIIGRTAKSVAAKDALSYVFGYTQFVDVSARGLYGGFFIGKSFDTFAPLGPAIVTADEVADPQKLSIRLGVNGVTRQTFGTDDMANSVATLIEYASAITTLRPGDVVATGTNHQGLGALQDGDRVELQVADWTPLTFSVRDPLRRTWPRGVDEATAERARTPR
jgi:2-keto-4-pentenoate hydratase/2-oxohepta-3-ene-1,7-dioic acid hydratase in catechol pathway